MQIERSVTSYSSSCLLYVFGGWVYDTLVHFLPWMNEFVTDKGKKKSSSLARKETLGWNSIALVSLLLLLRHRHFLFCWIGCRESMENCLWIKNGPGSNLESVFYCKRILKWHPPCSILVFFGYNPNKSRLKCNLGRIKPEQAWPKMTKVKFGSGLGWRRALTQILSAHIGYISCIYNVCK